MTSVQSAQVGQAKHANNHAPVGVFDSGIGGLSVIKHLRQELPNEEFLYLADSAYAPYGERSNEELISRSVKITEFFLTKGIKALVIACNTATAAAVAELRQRFPQLTIIAMEPGIKPAAARSESKVVGVLATRSTLQSEKFQKLSAQLAHETHTTFIPQACVGLVNQIEQGDLNSPAILELVRQYVTPLLEQQVDTLVLGCTHYPFVEPQIRAVIAEHSPHTKEKIYLIDTGEAVARRLRSLLERDDLLNHTHPHQKQHLAAWTTGQNLTLKRALGFINESDSLANELSI